MHKSGPNFNIGIMPLIWCIITILMMQRLNFKIHTGNFMSKFFAKAVQRERTKSSLNRFSVHSISHDRNQATNNNFVNK